MRFFSRGVSPLSSPRRLRRKGERGRRGGERGGGENLPLRSSLMWGRGRSRSTAAAAAAAAAAGEEEGEENKRGTFPSLSAHDKRKEEGRKRRKRRGRGVRPSSRFPPPLDQAGSQKTRHATGGVGWLPRAEGDLFKRPPVAVFVVSSLFIVVGQLVGRSVGRPPAGALRFCVYTGPDARN